MIQLPHHGSCFVCGSDNPHSIGASWFLTDNGNIYAEITFNIAQQGPPGYVHGGASAAVIDEAMGAAVWRAGYSVVAVNLQVDYKKPIPLGEKTIVEARIAEIQAKKILTSGEIKLHDGTVAVVGRGIYVPAPQLFKDVSFGD